MVNISGRSKGCSTCRKRRVKCDETRPICRRCQRWNFECDGPKETTFIHVGTESSTGSLVRRVSSATVSPINCRPLPQTALEAAGDEVCICYTRDHLLRGGLMVCVIADIKARDIARPADNAVVDRRVSHQAVLSFATILFGQQQHQDDIARRGYAMYSIALAQLNQALADPTRHTSEEVIVAVATLAISECLVPSGRNNYLDHMMGLQKLIDLQDPGTFWPSKPFGFRQGVRYMLLFASSQLKRPCILAKTEWKNALRVGMSPEELREQDLYEVLADCTVLFGKRKSAVANWNLDVVGSTEEVREVEQQGRARLARLCAWRRNWDDRTGNSPSGVFTDCSLDGPMDSLTSRTATTPPLIMATEALDRSMAVELVLFDVAITSLLRILASLPSESSPRQNSLRSGTATTAASDSAREYYASQERLAAREACRCIRSYVEAGHCLDEASPPILHWAVATALVTLWHDVSVEADWLRKLLTVEGRQMVGLGLWETYQGVNPPED